MSRSTNSTQSQPQQHSEINSISANVRVSPMPQPPSYDFATKNLEPMGNGKQYFHLGCLKIKKKRKTDLVEGLVRHQIKLN